MRSDECGMMKDGGNNVWVTSRDDVSKEFAWQAGYGAFSVGHSQLSALIRYIDNQKEHHRARTFKEELLDLLQRYGVNYDERYLWD
jgi:putative transposase